MSDGDKARDIYLTAFTDLNAAVFNAQEMVWQAERRVERELLRRIANCEQAFVCERCGTTVWVEIAEGELPILVENDGTPHEDNCRPQGLLFEEPPNQLFARADTQADTPIEPTTEEEDEAGNQ